uniref:Uncharacterized protein n=1 Tax=Musca domestica TaxID=7370 RepID=A0A1I8ML69_MUSDO
MRKDKNSNTKKISNEENKDQAAAALLLSVKMTLEGAKFVCLDETGNHDRIILAKGRKFSVGRYTTCDLILDDVRVENVHCAIEADAFGRITIRNFSTDYPISINGEVVQNKQNLFNNTKIEILDRMYLWEFDNKNSTKCEDSEGTDVSTPQKQIGIPKPSAFSSPAAKNTQKPVPRLTVHNFAYCIQSDEEGNTSIESNAEKSTAEIELAADEEVKESPQKTAAEEKPATGEEEEEEKEEAATIMLPTTEETGREVTPEPELKTLPTAEVQETPKMNLINCTNNKENSASTKKKKNLHLSLCHQSDVVITSFSPREAGVKIEKSFTAILKPKVLVTRAPNTPKSVYSTPKSVLNDDDDDDDGEMDKSKEILSFQTPSTSRKVAATTGGKNNTSMHLVDFTTPTKLAPVSSPFLKSALKASAKKLPLTPKGNRQNKTATEENLGLGTLLSTPVVSEDEQKRLETPSSALSVISVDSTDTSSVIEVLSDESTPGINANIVLKTPGKTEAGKAQATTPMRTPQSLMKRAILTSTKKQMNTPQRTEAGATTTPRREPINRIPLRTSIGALRSPVTPKTPAATETAPPSRRISMSTPSRKSFPAKRFESTPQSSSNSGASTTTTPTRSTRRSSLIPMSASRAQTSTPLSYANRKSTCKTSPLNKVRKSVGGVPLSSHISKARRSIIAASPAKFTSIKEKSPQQMMSDRLVTRARKSLCVTPSISKAINVAQVSKTPGGGRTPSILKKTPMAGRKSMAAATPTRSVLFAADKQKAMLSDKPDRSLTFIVDSDDDDGDKKKTSGGAIKTTTPLNVTFSPEKEVEIKSLETPIDVEELTASGKMEKENDNPAQQSNKSGGEEMGEEENNSQEDSKAMAVCALEESFAEIVDNSRDENISPKKNSTQIGDNEQSDSNCEEIAKDASKKSEEIETGFGEESVVESKEDSNAEDVPKKDDEVNVGDDDSEEPQAVSVRRVSSDVVEIVEPMATSLRRMSSDVIEVFAEPPQSVSVRRISSDVIELDSTADSEKSINNVGTEAVEASTSPSKPLYKPICEDITLEGSLLEQNQTHDSIIDKVIKEEEKSTNDLSQVQEEPDTTQEYENQTTQQLNTEKTEQENQNNSNEEVNSEKDLSEIVPKETEDLPLESENLLKESEDISKENPASKEIEDLPKETKNQAKEGGNEIVSKENEDSSKGNETVSKESEDATQATVSDFAETEEDHEDFPKENEVIVSTTEGNDVSPIAESSFVEEAPESNEAENAEGVEELAILDKSTAPEAPDTEETAEGNEKSTETGEEATEEPAVVETEVSFKQIEDNEERAEESEATEESAVIESEVEEAPQNISITLDSAEQIENTSALNSKTPEQEVENIELAERDSDVTTDKLLEEIEDVLNKSDEIQQKHFEQQDDVESINTLTEENESLRLTQDTVSTDYQETDVEEAKAEETSSTILEEENQISVPQSGEKSTEISKESLSESEVLVEPNSAGKEIEIDSQEANTEVSNKDEDPQPSSDEIPANNVEGTGEELNTEDTNEEITSNEVEEETSKEKTPGLEEENVIVATQEAEESNKDVLNQEDNKISNENEASEAPKTPCVLDVPNKSEDDEKVDDLAIGTVVAEQSNSDRLEKSEIPEPLSTQKTDDIASTDAPTENNKEVQNLESSSRGDDEKMSSASKDISNKLIENQTIGTRTPKRRSRRASMLTENTKTATDDGKENLEISLQSVAQKLAEEQKETLALTPRRSSRRKSTASTESTDESQNEVKALLTFTPRRSARRASMSAETTSYTPTAKKTRRASLSAVSETPLTPKRITRRRSSISLETEEISQVVPEEPMTSSSETTTEPIVETAHEDMGAIIEEEEEEAEEILDKSKKELGDKKEEITAHGQEEADNGDKIESISETTEEEKASAVSSEDKENPRYEEPVVESNETSNGAVNENVASSNDNQEEIISSESTPQSDEVEEIISSESTSQPDEEDIKDVTREKNVEDIDSENIVEDIAPEEGKYTHFICVTIPAVAMGSDDKASDELDRSALKGFEAEFGLLFFWVPLYGRR